MTDSREFTLPRGERKRAIELALRILEALPLERAWKIRCQVLRNERSDSQNSYLWGCPYQMICEHVGKEKFEKEELHEWFCGQYFGWKDKRVPKTPRNPEGYISVPRRTTTRNEDGKREVLPWNEFSDFWAAIQRFAADKMGLIIPDPDPNYAIHRERAQQRKAA